MKKDKVILIGGGKSKRGVPYDDLEWEIWTMNEMDAQRFDRHFEMHPMSVQSYEELAWLQACTKPVYVLKETNLCPTGVAYPIEEIMRQDWASGYFTCTMAYQIALAIYEDFKEIALYGLGMENGSPRERTIESACMQWWLGVARGRGIKVSWCESPLYERRLYGYEYHREMADVGRWLLHLVVDYVVRSDNMELKIKHFKKRNGDE